MNRELNDVSVFLQSKHIKVSTTNEWLKDCCDYYTSSTIRRSVEGLHDFVYEQWLLADLSDIGERCFPPDIFNFTKCKLDGKYAVQVNEVINIGESCYSQLKQIRSGEAISTLCEDDEKTPTWQPKRSRTLKLTLTDGISSFFAMEFEPIVGLREPFIPGLKILLMGPIECRRGILLLTSGSIGVLGGEVESLLVCNATENLLARKLELEENPNPFDRASPQQTTDNDECTEVNSNVESDNDFENSVNRRNQSNTIRIPGDRKTLDRLEPIESKSRVQRPNSRIVNCSNWLPSTNCANAIRKENSPKIGVVTPISSNKRNAESPPLQLDIKSTKTDPDMKVRTGTASHESRNEATSVFVQDLQNIALRNSPCFVSCVAKITKLIQKPRIKNEKWLVVAVMEDETHQCQVTFSDGFLQREIFEISAYEIKSQKDRMATNSALRDQIDDMIKNGVLKLLKLHGQFLVHVIPDKLPKVIDVI